MLSLLLFTFFKNKNEIIRKLSNIGMKIFQFTMDPGSNNTYNILPEIYGIS